MSAGAANIDTPAMDAPMMPDAAAEAAEKPPLSWLLVLTWTLLWFCTEPALVIFAKAGMSRHALLGWLPLGVVLFWQFAFSTLLGLVVAGRMIAPSAQVLVPNVLNGLNFAAQATQMGALLYGSLSFTQMIRAMEPVFLLFWSLVFAGLASTDVAIYLASVPIYVGAVVCGMTEVGFSWMAVVLGLSSNLFLTGANDHAVMRAAFV